MCNRLQSRTGLQSAPDSSGVRPSFRQSTKLHVACSVPKWAPYLATVGCILVLLAVIVGCCFLCQYFFCKVRHAPVGIRLGHGSRDAKPDRDRASPGRHLSERSMLHAKPKSASPKKRRSSPARSRLSSGHAEPGEDLATTRSQSYHVSSGDSRAGLDWSYPYTDWDHAGSYQ